MHWRQGGRDNFAITLRLWLKYKHLPRDGPWSSSEASSICQTHILHSCSVYAAGSRWCRRGWNMKIFHMLTRSHPSNYLLTIINSSTRRATKRQSLHHHPLKESFNSTQLFILVFRILVSGCILIRLYFLIAIEWWWSVPRDYSPTVRMIPDHTL